MCRYVSRMSLTKQKNISKSKTNREAYGWCCWQYVVVVFFCCRTCLRFFFALAHFVHDNQCGCILHCIPRQRSIHPSYFMNRLRQTNPKKKKIEKFTMNGKRKKQKLFFCVQISNILNVIGVCIVVGTFCVTPRRRTNNHVGQGVEIII